MIGEWPPRDPAAAARHCLRGRESCRPSQLGGRHGCKPGAGAQAGAAAVDLAARGCAAAAGHMLLITWCSSKIDPAGQKDQSARPILWLESSRISKLHNQLVFHRGFESS